MDEKESLTPKFGDVVEATDKVSVAQGVAEDHTDIQNAQQESREHPTKKRKSFLRLARA